MKRILCLAVCLIIITLNISFVSASSLLAIAVNGEEVNFIDEKPYIDTNSRTMVPIRFISESLGAKVEWIADERKVLITKQDTEISLIIGMKSALVNGENIKLDTVSIIKGDRTFVPLRFVGEAFGATVDWDDKNKVVAISTRANSKIEMPEGSYYNELYNLFTAIPEGMVGTPIGEHGYYTFNEDGTVHTFDFYTEENVSKEPIPIELSQGGAIFSPDDFSTSDSFSVQIFRNVERTKEQLIGQYIYFSDLKPEDITIFDKDGFSFVTTKGFEAIDVKEIGYNLKNKKLFIFHSSNLYVYSLIYDPQNTQALPEEFVENIINSIEINGVKISLIVSAIDDENQKTIEDIQLTEGIYTKALTWEENEQRLRQKYFPKDLDLSNMIRIDGGTFIDDEGREVSVKPFYVSKNLVTIKEWNETSEHKINIKEYNNKYSLDIKSQNYPAVFETEEKYGMVEIKDSLNLFKFCNSISKSQGIDEYYSFQVNSYGTSTLFEHNNGFRLLSEDELKYILRKTKAEPYKNITKSNKLSSVGLSQTNEFGIYDYDTNASEVTDFDYVLKVKDSSQLLCGFRYAKNAESPTQQLILDFFKLVEDERIAEELNQSDDEESNQHIEEDQNLYDQELEDM